MKPSERIKELAIEEMNKGIDPGFNGYRPQIHDWINGMIKYLDEQHNQ